MNYLERNQRIFEELGGVRLQRGDVVGHSSSMRFVSAGHYQSSALGNTLYVGLKEYTDSKRRKSDTEPRALIEMHCIRTIAEQLPHLEAELPIFYGVLLDSEGKTLGIVTEDFSQGGRYEVRDMVDQELFPMELTEIIPDLDHYEKSKICFSANGQRRLGDFSPIGFYDFLQRFPLNDLYNQLQEGKYTLRLDYEL